MSNLNKWLAALAIAGLTGPAAAQEEFTLQSTFPLTIPSIGESPQRWARNVEQATQGSVKISVYGAGEFVPGLQVFNAVKSGALDMGFDWVGFWADTIPATNLIGAMPFGPEPDIFLAWMFKGGGLEILQKAYDPHNVKVIPCHLLVPEAGGWFNKEINSVEDLKGLKMRMSGLGAKVLNAFGAVAQLMPVSELYVSLERGRLDALEFSTPQLDSGLGFHKIAKYYYFPGWHQPSSWDSVIVNMDVWNKLSEGQQHAMVEACQANITYNLYDQLNAQVDTLDEMREAGVEIRRFPEPVLEALKAKADEVLAEQASADAVFAEAYQSLSAYQAKLRTWYDLQALPGDTQ